MYYNWIYLFGKDQRLVEAVSSVIKLSELESAISSILAGFALTIVVLLIGRRPKRDEPGQLSGAYESAITIFVVSFFTSVYASVLYTFVTARQNELALFMFMPAAFVFAISAFLLMLGLTFVLVSHQFKDITDIAKTMTFLTVFIALFHYTYTNIWFMGIFFPGLWYKPLGKVTITLIIFIPILSYGGGIWRRLRNRTKSKGTYNPPLKVFALTIIGFTVLLGILQSFFDSRIFCYPQLIPIFLVALSIFAGWAIQYIPEEEEKERNSSGQTRGPPKALPQEESRVPPKIKKTVDSKKNV